MIPRPALEPTRLGLKKVFSLPKEEAPNEDRWAICPSSGRWALCDGASESWDARGWARALARSLARWGADSIALDRARVGYAKGLLSIGRDSDWLGERARARGSWSTALVLETSPRGLGALVSAIGDTTLFVLEGFELRLSFPMKAGDRFGSTPELIAETRADAIDPPFRHCRISLKELRRPSLVLATDALAARILDAPSEEAGLFRFLRAADEGRFAEWARGQVAAGRMARDDLTMLWVG